jgi:CheY-like chemotaxis protein
MATILVLDDEANVRRLLRAVLESAGYEVLEAAEGRAGLTLYRQRGADLVITDICMPTLDGLDLMIELTREFLNVKVIAMSGTRELLGRAKLLGARHTLRKPFDMKELLSAVKYELAH